MFNCIKKVKIVCVLTVNLILLIGCNTIEQGEIDQCLRHKIFKECMNLLPKGPDETVYNDWDEVVGKCSEVAYYQSRRLKKYIKPECRLNGN